MAAEVISREAPKARGPDISHNEGAHVIDALSHCEHGERRPDPGPGRQAVADWAQNPQTLDGPRPTRRDAGELQGQREEDGHESSGKNRQGEICAKTAPIKEESGAKTDWEAVSSLQVSRPSLFATLFAKEAAEIEQVAQTDTSTAPETTGLRASSPQLVYSRLEADALFRRVPA